MKILTKTYIHIVLIMLTWHMPSQHDFSNSIYMRIIHTTRVYIHML